MLWASLDPEGRVQTDVYFSMSSPGREKIIIFHQDTDVVGNPGGAQVQERIITQFVASHLREVPKKR